MGLNSRIEQHEKIINKNNNKNGSKILQHHLNKSHQCKLNSTKTFIFNNKMDLKKRKIKDSINRYHQFDESWYKILLQQKKKKKNNPN